VQDGGALSPANCSIDATAPRAADDRQSSLVAGERRNEENPAIDQAPLETQPTVITKAPVLAQYPLAGLHPRDIGRLLEGESLGHFELLEYVGGGGMGAVFRALDTMLNRTVAVKVLSQEQSGDEETLRRFQNEAQSAARLDHENISRVHYVGEDRGWHYIVFEFIEGANVRDIVNEQGPLSLADTVSYTLQLADALVHASVREVVHRDIKPSNVLITPDGRAKLVDMGLARQHHVEADGNDLTASGVTLGTFDYISPEQARDPRSADVRSDIYSLGCTLYFMLTGRPPFPEGTVLQKLLQHQGDEPADPRTFRPDLPDDLMRIMQRMLAKSPDKRYATPADLVTDLAAFAQRHGLPATATTSVVWVPPQQTPLKFWERQLPWMVPVVVLVILVAVLSLLWSHDAGRAAPPPLHTGPAPIDQPSEPKASESRKPAEIQQEKSAVLPTLPAAQESGSPRPDELPHKKAPADESPEKKPPATEETQKSATEEAPSSKSSAADTASRHDNKQDPVKSSDSSPPGDSNLPEIQPEKKSQ
jgi:serine/threonine-protein kinase